MKLIVFIFIVSFGFSICAQDSTKTLYYLESKSMQNHFGTLESNNGNQACLKTESKGLICFEIDKIKTLETLSNLGLIKSNGDRIDIRNVGGTNTRYFHSHSAHPLQKKEQYLTIHLLGVEYHYGLTRRLSIGGFSSWLATPLGMHLKYNLVSSNDNYLSLNSSILNSGAIMYFQGLGANINLIYTKGERSKNVSCAIGFGTLKGIAGMYRVEGPSQSNTYSFQNHDENKPYYIENVDTYNYLESTYRIRRSAPFSFEYNGILAASIGVSAAIPLDKSTSFVLDSKIYLAEDDFRNYNNRYADHTETVTYSKYDTVTNQVNYVTEDVVIGKLTAEKLEQVKYQAVSTFYAGLKLSTLKHSASVGMLVMTQWQGRRVSGYLVPLPMVSYSIHL